MLRLTQTEDFKTIISSCSTEEQVQKASDNFIRSLLYVIQKKILSRCFVSSATLAVAYKLCKRRIL